MCTSMEEESAQMATVAMGNLACLTPKTQPPRDRPVGLPAVMGLAEPLLGFASWGRSFPVGFVAAVAFIGFTLATG
jgi:hypothetical protein